MGAVVAVDMRLEGLRGDVKRGMKNKRSYCMYGARKSMNYISKTKSMMHMLHPMDVRTHEAGF